MCAHKALAEVVWWGNSQVPRQLERLLGTVKQQQQLTEENGCNAHEGMRQNVWLTE